MTGRNDPIAWNPSAKQPFEVYIQKAHHSREAPFCRLRMVLRGERIQNLDRRAAKPRRIGTRIGLKGVLARFVIAFLDGIPC